MSFTSQYLAPGISCKQRESTNLPDNEIYNNQEPVNLKLALDCNIKRLLICQTSFQTSVSWPFCNNASSILRHLFLVFKGVYFPRSSLGNVSNAGQGTCPSTRQIQFRRNFGPKFSGRLFFRSEPYICWSLIFVLKKEKLI